MGLKDPSLIIPSLNVSTTKLYDLPSLWFTIGKNWVLSIQVIRDQNVTPAQPTASSQISINTSALLQERVINLKIGSTLVFDLFFGIICPSKINRLNALSLPKKICSENCQTLCLWKSFTQPLFYVYYYVSAGQPGSQVVPLSTQNFHFLCTFSTGQN